MNTRKMNLREQILVTSLMTVLVVVLYVTVILLPQLDSLSIIERATEVAKDKIADKKSLQEPLPDTERLERSLEKLRADVIDLSLVLEKNGGPIQPNLESGQCEKMNLEISSLAQECGLLVLENMPISETDLEELKRKNRKRDDASIPLIPEDAQVSCFRKLSVETSFYGLREFVRRINLLDRTPIVMDFKIEIVKQEWMPEVNPLRVDFTWMIL